MANDNFWSVMTVFDNFWTVMTSEDIFYLRLALLDFPKRLFKVQSNKKHFYNFWVAKCFSLFKENCRQFAVTGMTGNNIRGCYYHDQHPHQLYPFEKCLKFSSIQLFFRPKVNQAKQHKKRILIQFKVFPSLTLSFQLWLCI